MTVALRVLILEDNVSDVQLLLHELRRAGIEPEARHVQTKSAFLAALEWSPQLILADYALPQYDGLQALQAVRERDLDTPFILISGSIGEELAVNAMKLGATDYLLKDRLARLGPAIHSALTQARLRQEKQATDLALRQSEERFRSLTENAPGIMAILNADATIRYASPAITPILGYTEEEVIGKSVYEFADPADLEDAIHAFNFRLEHPDIQPSIIEIRARHKDGSVRILEGRGNNLLADPSIGGIVLNLADITKRKHAENALQESETRYRAVTEAVSDYAYSYRIEPNGQVVLEWVTEAYERITGYSLTEILIAGSWRRVIHPDDMEIAEQHSSRIINGESSVAEYRIITKDGNVRWLHDSAQIKEDARQPQSKHIFGAAQDVTERKQTEQALRRSEELYRTLFDSVPVGLYRTTMAGVILQVNAALVRMLGYPNLESLLAQNTRDMFVEPEARSHQDALLRAHGVVHDFEIQLRRYDGSIIWVLDNVRTVRDQQDNILYCDGSLQDITERKKTDQELRVRAAHQAALNEIIATVTEAGSHLDVFMQAALNLILKAFSLEIGAIWLSKDAQRDAVAFTQGVSADTSEALTLLASVNEEDLIAPSVTNDWTKFNNPFAPIVRSQGIRASIYAPLLAEGRRIGGVVIASAQPREWSEEEISLMQAIGRQLGLASDHTRLFQETRQRAEQLEYLYDAGLQMNQMLESSALLESLLNIMNKTVQADCTDFFRYAAESNSLSFQFGAGYKADTDLSVLRSTKFVVGDERGLVGLVAANRTPLYVPDVHADLRWIPIDPTIRSSLWMPVERHGELRGILTVQSRHPNAFSLAEQHLVSLFANQLAVAMENARLFDETRQRLAELEAMNRISVALRAASSLDEMLPILLRETVGLLKATAATLWLYDPNTEQLRQLAESGFPHLTAPLKLNAGIAGHVFATGQVYVSAEFKTDPLTEESQRAQVLAGLGGVCVPIRATNTVIGVIFVSVQTPRQLDQNEINLLTLIAEIAGNAIHRTMLHERTEDQVHRLSALHTIDQAITSSFDLHVTFHVILEQIMTLLRVDAADILLLNPYTLTLDYSSGRGFFSDRITSTQLKLGQAYAGKVARERRPIFWQDRTVEDISPAFRKFLEAERFVMYYGIPLIAKGKVKGVLELFCRNSFNALPEWKTFVDAIAEQTAIAIDNATLFADFERSSTELMLAYDTTLEGWSRALDLRDKETEGHTQRVTEMTMTLAHAMGVSDADLVHIRRGALLHDIGKIGIPDQILFKPGALTEEEWAIMRQHPSLALELLSPIVYLRPALDIPYCHHERWDGSGYPRGLKEDQIPLSARIFAIVDVWDALRSDRPYRSRWTDDRIEQYLRENSGKFFDPRVVESFLKML